MQADKALDSTCNALFVVTANYVQSYGGMSAVMDAAKLLRAVAGSAGDTRPRLRQLQCARGEGLLLPVLVVRQKEEDKEAG